MAKSRAYALSLAVDWVTSLALAALWVWHFLQASCWAGQGLKPKHPWWTTEPALHCPNATDSSSSVARNVHLGDVMQAIAVLPLQECWALSALCVSLFWFLSCTFAPSCWYRKQRPWCLLLVRLVPRTLAHGSFIFLGQPSSYHSLYIPFEGVLLAVSSILLALPFWAEVSVLCYEALTTTMVCTARVQPLDCLQQTYTWLLVAASYAFYSTKLGKREVQPTCAHSQPQSTEVSSHSVDVSASGQLTSRPHTSSDAPTASCTLSAVDINTASCSATKGVKPLFHVSASFRASITESNFMLPLGGQPGEPTPGELTSSHSVHSTVTSSSGGSSRASGDLSDTSGGHAAARAIAAASFNAARHRPSTASAAAQITSSSSLPPSNLGKDHHLPGQRSAEGMLYSLGSRRYTRKLHHLVYHCKIPFAEPEQLPPGYVARLQHGIDEACRAASDPSTVHGQHGSSAAPAWQLSSIYIRRGCVQLTLSLVGLMPRANANAAAGNGGGGGGGSGRPRLGASQILTWLGLPCANGTTVTIHTSGSEEPQSSCFDEAMGTWASDLVVQMDSQLQLVSVPLVPIRVVPVDSSRCCSVSLQLQPTPSTATAEKSGQGDAHAVTQVVQAAMQGRCLQARLLPPQQQQEKQEEACLTSDDGEADGRLEQVTVCVEGVDSDGLVLVEVWRGSWLVGSQTILAVHAEATGKQKLCMELQQEAVAGQGQSNHGAASGWIPGPPTAGTNPSQGCHAFLEDLGLWWDYVRSRLQQQQQAPVAEREQRFCDSVGGGLGWQAPPAPITLPGHGSQGSDWDAVNEEVQHWAAMYQAAISLVGYAAQRGMSCTMSRVLSDLVALGYTARQVRRDTMEAHSATLLHQAVCSGCVKTVQALLMWGHTAGSPWDWEDGAPFGVTPLDLLRASRVPGLRQELSEGGWLEGSVPLGAVEDWAAEADDQAGAEQATWADALDIGDADATPLAAPAGTDPLEQAAIAGIAAIGTANSSCSTPTSTSISASASFSSKRAAGSHHELAAPSQGHAQPASSPPCLTSLAWLLPAWGTEPPSRAATAAAVAAPPDQHLQAGPGAHAGSPAVPWTRWGVLRSALLLFPDPSMEKRYVAWLREEHAGSAMASAYLMMFFCTAIIVREVLAGNDPWPALFRVVYTLPYAAILLAAPRCFRSASATASGSREDGSSSSNASYSHRTPEGVLRNPLLCEGYYVFIAIYFAVAKLFDGVAIRGTPPSLVPFVRRGVDSFAEGFVIVLAQRVRVPHQLLIARPLYTASTIVFYLNNAFFSHWAAVAMAVSWNSAVLLLVVALDYCSRSRFLVWDRAQARAAATAMVAGGVKSWEIECDDGAQHEGDGGGAGGASGSGSSKRRGWGKSKAE